MKSRPWAPLAFAGLGAILLPACGVFRGGGDDPLDFSASRIESDTAARDATTAALLAEHQRAPEEPYWCHRLAEVRLTVGDDTEGERWLHRALEADPAYAPSLTELSRLLHDEGRHFEAIDLLAPAVAACAREDEPALRACLALHQVAAGDPAGAEATLAPLESRGEHWREVGSALTYVRLHGDRYREAPRWAERALEADQSAANCNNYGIALLQEGKPDEARSYFLRALEIDPSIEGALYNLAIVEKFYFFDEAAARGYFERYASRSDEDPDNLRELFGIEAPSASAGEEKP